MLKPSSYHSSDTSVTPIRYSFLHPLRVNVRKPDGTVVLTGYGIGEIIEILEPSLQSLAARYEHWTEIPLADGSTLLDVPVDFEPRRVY